MADYTQLITPREKDLGRARLLVTRTPDLRSETWEMLENRLLITDY
jgi:hypothetical protein